MNTKTYAMQSKKIAFITGLLCLANNLVFSQQLKADIAYKKLLVEVSVNKKGQESYEICVTKKIKDTLELKDEPQCQLVSTWSKAVYTAVVLNNFESLFSDSAQKANYWIGNEKHRLDIDTLINESFENISFKKEFKPFAPTTEINYGLTDEEVENLQVFKIKLHLLQDSISLLKRLLSGVVLRDKPGNNEKDLIRSEALNKSTGFLNKTISNIKSMLSTSKDIYAKIYDLKTQKGLITKQIRQIESRRKYLVNLIGNANVVSSFKSVDKTQFNAGFGVIAIKPGKAEFIGVLTVAQVNDTVSSNDKYDFGQSVLVPGVRRFSLLTSFRDYSMFPNSSSAFMRKIGWGFNFNATPYRWVIDSVADKSTTTRVVPFSIDMIFPFTWILQADEGRDIAISTDIGWTCRYIGGDISKEERKLYLGNEKNFYHGPLVGLNIKFNALRAQFYCPFILSSGHNKVSGLSSGQVYASIGIIGNVFNDISNILKKKEKEAEAQ